MILKKLWILLTKSFYYRLIRIYKYDNTAFYAIEQKHGVLGSWVHITLPKKAECSHFLATQELHKLIDANNRYIAGFRVKTEVIKE
jgi:hypothetical protein